jgi:hypothetical protein
MALRAQSKFLFGFEITDTNKYIDFKISGGGLQLTAILDIGYYSLTSLLTAIAAAISGIDPTNTYTVTADRSINGGTENRVTIATSGAFLSLLFSSGTHAVASVASLIGFAATDRTGATTYTGASTAGTALVPTMIGYNYVEQARDQKVFGSVNISANGIKETIVFQIQRFIELEFKYEPVSMVTPWTTFLQWAIRQRPFDFTPEISSPNSFFQMTLDKTTQDGTGLAYRMPEMLPDFPFLFQTGLLTMRIIEV